VNHQSERKFYGAVDLVVGDVGLEPAYTVSYAMRYRSVPERVSKTLTDSEDLPRELGL